MKLRVYLLLANGMSILLIVAILLFLYRYMLLSERQFIWLTLASLGAGLLSGLLHFMLVRPVEAAVRRVGEGSARIARGDLSVRVPLVGPAELKTLAGQFNEMGDQLEQSFRQLQAVETARRELVANMAHDLRTPLASLQAYAEALEDGILQDEPTKRRYLGTIRSESVRLGKLIQQLFEISTLDAKVDAGARGAGTSGQHAEKPASRPAETERAAASGQEASPDADACVLEDALVEVLPRFAPSMEAKSLRLDISLPQQTLVCRIAPQSLGRVLQNLLENAVRYSPPGGVLRIEAYRKLSGAVYVGISDEGEGVPDEDRERIFERFYRVDRSRGSQSGGAGLGLSIAKSLVEQAGGSIGVVRGGSLDAGGQDGSVFWFTVPGVDGSQPHAEERDRA
ncbi:cell wall metabolism sensor histidine kinase WalK [Paenibacillus sp. R14(2021)]|uniref:sensor histidine kinase n=1 Tax=Paenibacillus sp. R14(2021) TaxID=2859228 RepID=UPI001C614112|nr:ATP-binding protein [Paenibacillus sp. R14(2021)]